MSLLTLNQAAKVVKKSKSTLCDAIKSGRLVAVRNSKNQWQINKDELFRIYPNTERDPNEIIEADSRRPNEETAILQQQIEHLEQRINDIKGERDDLRRRLNEEVEERRKLSELIAKAFGDDVLPLSGILDLTLYQYKIFTTLIKGMDAIKFYYTQIDYSYTGITPIISPPPLDEEIFKNLKEIGVLRNGVITEKLKEATDSILQNRQFTDLFINDIVEITKRYSQW